MDKPAVSVGYMLPNGWKLSVVDRDGEMWLGLIAPAPSGAFCAFQACGSVRADVLKQFMADMPAVPMPEQSAEDAPMAVSGSDPLTE